jgi:hypothetical protein
LAAVRTRTAVPLSELLCSRRLGINATQIIRNLAKPKTKVTTLPALCYSVILRAETSKTSAEDRGDEFEKLSNLTEPKSPKIYLHHQFGLESRI